MPGLAVQWPDKATDQASTAQPFSETASRTPAEDEGQGYNSHHGKRERVALCALASKLS